MWKRLLLLFLTSACLMTVELVAGRLVAPYLGNSLYTWTSIIGACLSGMSFGHLFGGWLADRQQPQKYLGILLINAALLVVATLPFTPVFLNSSIVRAWHPLAGIFVPALMLFGLPCFFMASVSPLVYRLALQDLQGVGGLLGRLSASGVVGSIAGTYLTGFWLIPSLGVTAIVVGAAALLGVLGFLNMPWARISRVIAALIVGALVTAVPFRWPTALAGGCDVESAYFCIRITTSGGAPGAPEHTRHLVLDRLIHSGYQPASPDTLWYDYEQLMAWVIQSQEATARNVLFLGGGGYVLPRWMERHYPDTSLEVIEIDPAVTKVALERFMPGPTRIKTANGDARQVLYNKSSNTAYDLVIGDAFGARSPHDRRVCARGAGPSDCERALSPKRDRCSAGCFSWCHGHNPGEGVPSCVRVARGASCTSGRREYVHNHRIR